jgi:hypothetical protein
MRTKPQPAQISQKSAALRKQPNAETIGRMLVILANLNLKFKTHQVTNWLILVSLWLVGTLLQQNLGLATV